MLKKTLHPGKGVLALRIGSHEFNEWLNDNPLCRLSPFVCKRSLCHIAERRHGVDKRLHGADLYGQISSESSGTRQISGTGGQLDFVCGAQMGGGKAFICMSSTHTDKNGVRHSRIVPTFSGDIITTRALFAFYVATEYGVVNSRRADNMGAR